MTRKPPQDVVDIYEPIRVDDGLGKSPEALWLRGLLPAGAMVIGRADIQRPSRRLRGDDARA